MEAKAILRFARITPRKARRVVDLIRGKRASEAMVSLKFMPYRGAKLVEKVLKSAMANAEQVNDHLDIDKLRVKTVLVDQGPMMKRMEPRAQGRANMIKKKTSHITIVVAEE
ncbi:MAG: 50S ribosomal protein L22 [Nitrospiraceae bacterium]|jgi:large subunit ribosomal protein L22|nr:50S ribosomal protein L22 [Nitrospiraceae bacterium]